MRHVIKGNAGNARGMCNFGRRSRCGSITEPRYCLSILSAWLTCLEAAIDARSQLYIFFSKKLPRSLFFFFFTAFQKLCYMLLFYQILLFLYDTQNVRSFFALQITFTSLYKFYKTMHILIGRETLNERHVSCARREYFNVA